MSFIISTVKCKKCGKEMNVAFGIVGTTMIGDGGPDKCPDCKGELTKFMDGWHTTTKDTDHE